MQSTFIKIKFTPLIRHLHEDNTNCILEIMPDISSIQNLDKLEWNEKKQVEYSVPVIYKILLKKDTSKENKTKEAKMYYSCIDLRLLSTNACLACGDVTKVLSDNYILSKFTSDFNERFNLNKKLLYEFTPKDVCLEKPTSVSLTKVFSKNNLCLDPITEDDGSGAENQLIENSANTLSNARCNDIIYDNKVNKETHTEYTVSKEAITDVSNIMNDKEKKPKLTITSVCRLNAIDSPISDDTIKSNSKVFFTFEHDSICNDRYSFPTSGCFCENIDEKFRRKNYLHRRILPDMRVALLMLSVENEMLPLKVLLNVIYKKCMSLGLLWNSNTFEESTVTRWSHDNNKMKLLTNNKRKPKCNRVVYSIVFEE